jgi:NADH-quinone oxidoreductase subunit J
MSAQQIVFLVTAGVALISAALVVTVRNLIHAGLWLVITLAAVAAIYVQLEADFLAVVQVILYIGAIAILIIFSVMLTRRVMADTGPQRIPQWPLAAVVALLVAGGLAYLLVQVPWPAAPDVDVSDTVLALGEAFVDPNLFVIPFEVATIILLVALIGSISLALPERESD